MKEGIENRGKQLKEVKGWVGQSRNRWRNLVDSFIAKHVLVYIFLLIIINNVDLCSAE